MISKLSIDFKFSVDISSSRRIISNSSSRPIINLIEFSESKPNKYKLSSGDNSLISLKSSSAIELEIAVFIFYKCSYLISP